MTIVKKICLDLSFKLLHNSEYEFTEEDFNSLAIAICVAAETWFKNAKLTKKGK